MKIQSSNKFCKRDIQPIQMHLQVKINWLNSNLSNEIQSKQQYREWMVVKKSVKQSSKDSNINYIVASMSSALTMYALTHNTHLYILFGCCTKSMEIIFYVFSFKFFTTPKNCDIVAIFALIAFNWTIFYTKYENM